MMPSLVGFILAACLSANPEQPAPPTLEGNATKDGIEIFVGKMKIVANRFNLDQAKQILIVEGRPALLQLSHAAEPRKVIRGTRITVNLANGSVTCEDVPNRARIDSKEK